MGSKDIKNQVVSKVKSGLASVNTEDIKKTVSGATEVISEKTADIKNAAMETKEDITNKLTELDRMLEEEITNYNDAYTLMNDKGVQLFIERRQAVDTISFVENLINSIANHPKEFDDDFEQIEIEKKEFTDSCEFADRELIAARKAAGSAGAGIAGGAAVAMMAPTAAMWVATTFGTASTGAAISSLSGAAATNAALAWLGGGAAAAGGGGMAAGNALLAMAGPIGWTIAGATLLTSIVLFTKSRMKLNKEKNEQIEALKRNTETVKELDIEINGILESTRDIRAGLNESYMKSLPVYGMEYGTLSSDQKSMLGALVNQTKALSKLFEKTVG